MEVTKTVDHTDTGTDGIVEKQAVGGSTSAEDLIKAAHMLLDEHEVSLSPSKVSRIVRTYKHQVEKNGFPFVDFLLNQVDLAMHQRRADLDKAKVITYADPTGEDAVHNVLSEMPAHNPGEALDALARAIEERNARS